MPRGQEDGQRAGDDHVVERAARVVDDPVPLVVVDHLAPAVDEHARRARVEHEQARVAEVAVERPAARRRLAVPRVGEPPKQRAGVLVALTCSKRLVLSSSGGERFPRCW